MTDTSARERDAQRLSVRTTNAVFFAAGLAMAMLLAGLHERYATAPASEVRASVSVPMATKHQAAQSLVFLAHRMPNTHFTHAEIDTAAPGLLRLYTSLSQSPVYFDPIHHYLIIGLVVNMHPRPALDQRIAPGIATPNKPTVAGGH